MQLSSSFTPDMAMVEALLVSGRRVWVKLEGEGKARGWRLVGGWDSGVRCCSRGEGVVAKHYFQ